MPDTQVDRSEGEPYDRKLEMRVTRLEEGMHDLKALLTRMEPMVVHIEASLPHLATREQIAELRGEMFRGDVSLRAEVAALGTELRGEIDGGNASLRTEIAALCARVSELPSKTYLWAVLGVLMTSTFAAFGAGLAAVASLR